VIFFIIHQCLVQPLQHAPIQSDLKAYKCWSAIRLSHYSYVLLSVSVSSEYTKKAYLLIRLWTYAILILSLSELKLKYITATVFLSDYFLFVVY
jgi:hypothetical protein